MNDENQIQFKWMQLTAASYTQHGLGVGGVACNISMKQDETHTVVSLIPLTHGDTPAWPTSEETHARE